MNRIKSFTLVEIIIVMILTGMVISAVYLSYSYFNKRFRQINDQFEQRQGVMEFYNVLYKDFHMSNMDCKISEEGIVFDNNRVYVKYLLIKSNNFVIRNEKSVQDTFHFMLLNQELRTKKDQLELKLFVKILNLNEQNIVLTKRTSSKKKLGNINSNRH